MPISRNQANKKNRSGRKPLGKEETSAEKDAAVQEKLAENRKERAAEHKTKGNEAFSAGNWLAAVEHFTSAIAEDSSDHVFYSNRSAANLKLLRTSDAVDDAYQCTRLAKDWSKGYSRLGAALWGDRQLKAAVKAFDDGLKLDPDNEAMKTSREEVLKALELEPEEAETEAKDEEAEAGANTAYVEKDIVIGIDLGTTYSAVAVWDVAAMGVRIIPDEGGNRTTPSYVAWTDDGERVVGHRAKALASKAPQRTLFDVKRIIGQRANEQAVIDDMKRLPYKINKDDEGRLEIEVVTSEGTAPKKFTPEQVSAMVLGKMKEIAEKDLGRSVSKAVVTVPAYFNDAQRKATQAAGAIAGLEVLRIINEPTAAALGYGLDQQTANKNDNENHILVFDLGGGTFDVSVLRVEGGVVEVRATGGDTHLGGEDFDNVLVDWIMSELKKKGHPQDQKVRVKAKKAAETAKRGLSSSDSMDIEIGEIVSEQDGVIKVTRAEFEKLCKPLFDRTLDTVKAVIKDAKIATTDIDEIVLVGGSTRVPVVQKQLQEMFGGKALCKSINPDEAVAYGAAVQGAILSGTRLSNCTEMLLIDVTPLSLGIETEGKHHSIIIPRNTAVPCVKESTYTTTSNYQESIDVCVYEGERPCTDQNHKLGEFVISGIERAKQGEAQVVVRFALDSNGVLEVTALDKKTRATNSCRIADACRSLSAEEIKRMVSEAEAMKTNDEDYAEKLQIKNALEEAAYDLPEDECQEITDWLQALSLESTSKSVLERKLAAVQKKM
jgi:L1 cell adhesion molecule like protein